MKEVLWNYMSRTQKSKLQRMVTNPVYQQIHTAIPHALFWDVYSPVIRNVMREINDMEKIEK